MSPASTSPRARWPFVLPTEVVQRLRAPPNYLWSRPVITVVRCPESFSGSLPLLAASVATGVYRQLPRQDLHLQVSRHLFTALGISGEYPCEVLILDHQDRAQGIPTHAGVGCQDERGR